MFDELNDDRVKQGYLYLYKWLLLSQRSEKECVNRLFEKKYSKDEISLIIDEAKNSLLINDKSYVESFIISYKNKYGVNRLVDKLIFEKGIDKEIVKEIVNEEITSDFENDLAMSFAIKYLSHNNQEESIINKLIGYLLNKGFDWDNINYVKKNLKLNRNLDEY